MNIFDYNKASRTPNNVSGERERERERESVSGLDTSPTPVVGVVWGTNEVSVLNQNVLIWC